MPEEALAIKENTSDFFVEDIKFDDIFNATCEKYESSKNTIYLTQSGIGGVNAAINLSVILNNINIDGIFLLGVGGALTDMLNIGDLVISESVIQHDYIFQMDFGKFCITPGKYAFDLDGLNELTPNISADSELIKIIQDTTHDVDVYEGIVASGSEFSGTVLRKKEIHIETRALLVDMEAAAVSQVCHRAGKPFVVAKTVSDRLNAQGSIETDFQKFLTQASITAAQIAKYLLSK